MKKYIYLFILFILTIGLTSCDLLGEDGEEFTEAYCRENPDSSICQGVVLEDLQDEGVEELFWSIEQDSKKDIDNFCETYFSITNIDLLDTCRDNQESLLPEDLEGYEVDTIVYDEEYIVTIKKDESSSTYVFRFKLITVEQETYVEEWSYEEIEPNSDSEEITLEKATELANEFAEKLANDAITSTVFCEEYYPNNKDLCSSERDLSVQAGLEITYKELHKEGEDYTLEIHANYGGYFVPVEEELNVSFFKLDTGDWYIEVSTVWTSPTEVLHPEEEIYVAVLSGLLNETIPDEYCTTYFPTIKDECILFHQKVIAFDIGVSITSFTINGSSFDVEFTLRYPRHKETETVSVTLIDKDTDIEVEQTFPSIPPLDSHLMVLLVLDRLNLTSTTSLDTCRNAHPDYQVFCTQLEEQFQTDGLQWELHHIVKEDNTAKVSVIESDADGNEKYKDIDFEFEQDDNGWNFKITKSFDYTHPETHYFYRLLYPMGIGLEDDTISDGEYCEMYGEYFADCVSIKNEMLYNEWDIFFVIPDVVDDTEPYIFEIDIYDHDYMLVDTLVFEFNYEITDEGEFVVDGDQVFRPPHEEYSDIIHAYIEAYLDETKTDQDIYDQFNQGFMMMGMHRREYIVTQGLNYDVTDITWTSLGYNFEYQATVVFTREGFSKEVTLRYELFPRGDGSYNLFIVEDLTLITEVEFNNYLTKLLLDFTATELTTEDFCDFYFQPEIYVACYDLRHQVLRDTYTVTLNQINPGDFSVFFDLDFTHPDSSVTTLSFVGMQYRDILHNPHVELFVDYSDPELLEDLNSYLLTGLVYGFNTHGINLYTFCSEVAVCQPETFDNIEEQIHQVDAFARWDFFDLANPELKVIMRFEFMDGDIEFHEYSATYVLDEDNWKIWTFVYLGKYYELPYDAISLDQLIAPGIWDNFIEGFQDPTITLEQLSNDYFGNAMVFSTSSFMRYRELILTEGATVTTTGFDFYMDDMGMLVFTTTVTIDFPTFDDYVMEYHVAIYANPDGYYIIFTY